MENTGFGHLLMKPRGELAAGGSVRSVDMDLRKVRPGERKTFVLPLPKGASASSGVLLSVRLDTPAAQVVHFANDAMREGVAVRLDDAHFFKARRADAATAASSPLCRNAQNSGETG